MSLFFWTEAGIEDLSNVAMIEIRHPPPLIGVEGLL